MTRDEAIDLLDNLIGMIEDSNGSDYNRAFRMAIEAFKRQHGKWIITNPRYLHSICNNCGYFNVDSPSFSYCPNCGADMRGEEDDKGRNTTSV